MPIRTKVLPEGIRQGNMFKFLNLPEPLAPPRFDAPSALPIYYLAPSYDSPSHDDFSFQDMVRLVLDIIDPDKTRFSDTAIIGYLFHILVCPTCNSPVEPVACSYFANDLQVELKRHKNPTFAECPKCNVSYFIPELVAQRSFRKKFPSDEVTVSIDYIRHF